MNDFWPSCGFRLLRRNAQRRLEVTDDYLRTWLGRPELAPVAESCPAERALNRRLIDQPRAQIAPDELIALADRDARENYSHFLRFRDRLLACATVEGCYAGLFAGGGVDIAPVFVDQMAQLLVRAILDGTDDALEARAAELFFRAQAISIQRGVAMAADALTADRHAETGGFGVLGRMLVESKTAPRRAQLQVLTRDNAMLYWMRDERYDTVLPVSAGQPGADALCRVLEKWIAHFHAIAVTIVPVRGIEEGSWAWHVGLDAEATALLNDLYLGREVEDERIGRLLCFFELRFRNPSDMKSEFAGHPVHLAMAMTADSTLRLKPQNLLTNLPVASLA
jgi:uncharacterized protein DUF6352